MSRQELPVLDAACCAPLTGEALSDESAAELAKGFKALGDPVRLRLLSLIASRKGGEVCVCELTDAFTLTGPTISHHLRVLREAGLIDCQRRGTWVYYWILPAKLAALSQLLDVSGAAAPASV
ncbi:metalloregulator ArsR/SmtB family transcription factor [Rugosimonospora acidiphila]|uniref:Metalloregulator ArsR/SmtB family transcription factor n=1 Tax=Rugosimonospora acidiphila TaxID=556531 RepID=A0ABP9RTP2_9ACTN